MNDLKKYVAEITETLIAGKPVAFDDFHALHPDVDRLTFDVLRAKADREALIAWGVIAPIKSISQETFDSLGDPAKLDFLQKGGIIEPAPDDDRAEVAKAAAMVTNLDGSKSIPYAVYEGLSRVEQGNFMLSNHEVHRGEGGGE